MTGRRGVLFASPHNHAQCNGASGQGGDGVLEEVAVLSARSKSEERIQESEQRTGECACTSKYQARTTRVVAVVPGSMGVAVGVLYVCGL